MHLPVSASASASASNISQSYDKHTTYRIVMAGDGADAGADAMKFHGILFFDKFSEKSTGWAVLVSHRLVIGTVIVIAIVIGY